MAEVLVRDPWDSNLPVYNGPFWDIVPDLSAFSSWEVVSDNFVPGIGVLPAPADPPTVPVHGTNGDPVPTPISNTEQASGANGDAVPEDL